MTRGSQKYLGVPMLLNKQVYIVRELVSVNVRTCHALLVMLVLLENKNLEKNHRFIKCTKKLPYHHLNSPCQFIKCIMGICLRIECISGVIDVFYYFFSNLAPIKDFKCPQHDMLLYTVM